MSTHHVFRTATMVVAAVVCGTLSPAASAELTLQRVEVLAFADNGEVTYDIGQLIAAGRVEPAAAIGTEPRSHGAWLLRTPESPPELRWPRNLLNAGTDAPALTIDLQLRGTYDVYAIVRAVDASGDLNGRAPAADPLPMALELALDDASHCEVVGAKGFPDRHFDTEVLAGCGWCMTDRKLIVRSLGKPIYLYGFRFVPSGTNAAAPSGTVRRWLATEHVTIVAEPEKHFAFPGVALLPGGDLVVVYREGTVHGVEPTGKVSLSRSTDGGRTWLPRVTAWDRPDVDDRDPSVFQMRDGTLLLFSADCLCTSPDGGRTWTEPLPTPVFGPKGGVEDDDGHIVYGGLQRVVQVDFTRIQGTSAILQADAAYRSSDQGRSWDVADEIVLRMDGGTPPGQPRVVADVDLGYPTSVQLTDGSILTVYYHNTAGSNCFIAGTSWKLPALNP